MGDIAILAEAVGRRRQLVAEQLSERRYAAFPAPWSCLGLLGAISKQQKILLHIEHTCLLTFLCPLYSKGMGIQLPENSWHQLHAVWAASRQGKCAYLSALMQRAHPHVVHQGNRTTSSPDD